MIRRYPKISCFSTVFGRVECLEEAMQCFIDQDYPGEKELLILNDLPEQTLVYNGGHPQIRIINYPTRFPTLGEKCNYAVRQTDGEIVVVWEDDDLYLPRYLSITCEGMITLKPKGLLFPSHALRWREYGNSIEKNHKAHTHHRQFTRKMFDGVGGYSPISVGHDVQLIRSCRRRYGEDTYYLLDDVDVLFMVGSWRDEVDVHLSCREFRFINGRRNAFTGYDLFYNVIKERITNGTLPSGVIDLTPHYKHNYCEMFNDFLVREDKYSGNKKHAYTKYMLGHDPTAFDAIRRRTCKTRSKWRNLPVSVSR